MKTASRNAIKTTLVLIPAFLFAVYFYTLLHEGGHALVAIMYGGKVINFVLGFNAHVTYSGANFTRLGEPLFNAAGFLLPYLVLLSALLFYNRGVKNRIYHFAYAVFTIMIAGSSIAWVIIPIISIFSAPPAGDDVTKFLEASKINPLLVSVLALVLIALLLLIARQKGLTAKVKELFRASSQAESAEPKLHFAIVLPFILIATISVLAFSQVFFHGKVFETSFTMNVTENKKVMEMSFEVKKERSYRMDLALEAEGMLTDVQIFDNKGNMVYQNLCEWMTLSTSLYLDKGNYRFMLTFIRDPGVMEKHLAEMGYHFSSEQLDTLMKVYTKGGDNGHTPVSFSAVIR